MRRPTSIPPGKAGLIVLAVAFAPLVLGAAKPAMRAVGRGIRKFGEATERLFGAEPTVNKPPEPTEKSEAPTAPKVSKSSKKKAAKGD